MRDTFCNRFSEYRVASVLCLIALVLGGIFFGLDRSGKKGGIATGHHAVDPVFLAHNDFDGDGGIYFIQMVADGFSDVRKVKVLRRA